MRKRNKGFVDSSYFKAFNIFVFLFNQNYTTLFKVAKYNCLQWFISNQTTSYSVLNDVTKCFYVRRLLHMYLHYFMDP